MEIKVKNLSYAYKGHDPLFTDISFNIKAGQIICILGPNGIGKTTLLNCIANLLLPSKGNIYIDGMDMNKMSTQDIAKIISYVPQSIVPSFDYRVLDYIVTGCAPWLGTFERPGEEHYSLAKKMIGKMGISHIENKAYTKISGGERQQVSIARALTQQAKVILMDEPTAHLDYGNQINVLKTIKKMAQDGYAVVFTSHNPDQALLLKDKVAAFNSKGEFYFGDYKDVVNENFLHSIYGVDLHLAYIEEIGRNVCISPGL